MHWREGGRSDNIEDRHRIPGYVISELPAVDCLLVNRLFTQVSVGLDEPAAFVRAAYREGG
jgi:hypothetical protein